MRQSLKKYTIILIFLATFFFIWFGREFDIFRKAEINDSFYCKDCNVILITLTNLRYDHLSGSGYFRPTTPNLDAFAKESLVFDNAFGHSSWTLPEAISIFTSLYPYKHGIMNRYDGSVLSENTPTLIDILSDSGYTTAGFTGGFDYNPAFGLTNRFGEYQECTEGEKQVSGYGKIGCTMPNALEWIKNHLDEKFFVQIQGYDAHCPFSQQGGFMYDKDYKGTVDYSNCLWTFDKSEPETIDGKLYYPVYSPTTEGKASVLLGEEDISHLIALYDESITLSDELFGSFIEEIKKLGLEDNTIIIFTSEHGDMLGKHGRFMRGGPLRGTLYDDVLHIPLMIKHPELKPARLEGLAEHIDIAPTLLDFLGIKEKFSFQGKSLIPLLLRNKEVNRYIFAGVEFHPGTGNLYFQENTRVEAIRTKYWKLIRETIISQVPPSHALELYDLINDKEELYNLADTKKDILDDLERRLDEWSEDTRKE
ncbi:MAG: sulfatase [Candidatus Nealsonbacteria bacterium]